MTFLPVPRILALIKNKIEADHECIYGTYDAEAISSFETTTQQSQQRNIDLHSRSNSICSDDVCTAYCGLAIKSSVSTLAIAECAFVYSFAKPLSVRESDAVWFSDIDRITARCLRSNVSMTDSSGLGIGALRLFSTIIPITSNSI